MLPRLPVLALAALFAACAPERAPPRLDPPVARPADDAVRVAGPAMATPLVRHLAEHFAALEPRGSVQVEEPLGEAGALRALYDGAIDAAVVALPEGQAPPAGGVAIGASRVVVAAGPGVNVRRLELEELTDTFSGALDRWPDGTPRRFILRPEHDAAQGALGAAWPPLRAAVDEALARGTARLVTRDEELADVLRRTPGALVVTDSGQLRFRAVPVWFVALEDADGRRVEPRLVLWVVPGHRVGPRLRRFLDFLGSDAARALVRDLGYEAPP